MGDDQVDRGPHVEAGDYGTETGDTQVVIGPHAGAGVGSVAKVSA